MTIIPPPPKKKFHVLEISRADRGVVKMMLVMSPDLNPIEHVLDPLRVLDLVFSRCSESWTSLCDSRLFRLMDTGSERKVFTEL
uniref:Uncharacterized protein n=1 Tax=Oryzias latipes TaxID=8090 RepID=A0A3B3H8T2_ORYLA